jgi:hypothetical protein
MFDDGVSPFQKQLLGFLDQNVRSSKKMIDALHAYAAAVEIAGTPKQDALIGMDAPTKEGLWKLATKKLNSAERAKPKSQANPKSWLKIYNRFTALQQAGEKLSPEQHRILNQVEEFLGQRFMFEGEGYKEGSTQAPQPQQEQGMLFSGRRVVGEDGFNLLDLLTPEQREQKKEQQLELFGNNEMGKSFKGPKVAPVMQKMSMGDLFDQQVKAEPVDRQKLIKDHLDVAEGVARKFENIPGVDPDDVKQEAYQILIKAAQQFDAGKGRPFRFYAARAIQNRLINLYHDQMTGRVVRRLATLRTVKMTTWQEDSPKPKPATFWTKRWRSFPSAPVRWCKSSWKARTGLKLAGT